MPVDRFRVLLAACPPDLESEVRYVLGEIALRLGWPLAVTADSEQGPVDLAYGLGPAPGGVPFVPLDSRCYDRATVFASRGTPELWVPSAAAPEDPPDLIGGVFRLLTLLDESQVAEAERDRRGIFRTAALPPERRRSAARPLVEHHVDAIRRLVASAGRLPEVVPRWPEGRRWALLVTHDTDAVSIAAWPERLFNTAKAALRLDRTRLGMAVDGFRYGAVPIADNPLYGFSGWAEALAQFDVRSAFYLFLRCGVRADLNDCRSSVADRRFDWSRLRALADQGFEFGLHPAIAARGSVKELQSAREMLEHRLDRPVTGLRHHYWAIDWRRPHLTYRRHLEAGFSHDLSMAWRDAPGFRAGTSLPFEPWDPERRASLRTCVIPTAVMDGHVIETDNDADAAGRALSVMETVANVGGVAALDWHTEAAFNGYCYRGHRACLETVLKRTLAQDVWVATPSQLAAHWQARRTAILAS